MNNGERCCGTCIHHWICASDNATRDKGWICTNRSSEFYTDWTDYKHTCDEWEGRG